MLSDNPDLAVRFKAKTKEAWVTQDSILVYAGIQMIKDAIEAAGSTDRAKVAEAPFSCQPELRIP